MSYQERYHEWTCQLAAIVHNKNEEERRRNRLITAVCINECTNFKKSIKKGDFGLIHYLKNDMNMDFTMHLCRD